MFHIQLREGEGAFRLEDRVQRVDVPGPGAAVDVHFEGLDVPPPGFLHVPHFLHRREVGGQIAVPEAVDGLTGISHHDEGAAGIFQKEALEDVELGDAGVLKFVDEPDFVLVVQSLPELGAFRQGLPEPEDQAFLTEKVVLFGEPVEFLRHRADGLFADDPHKFRKALHRFLRRGFLPRFRACLRFPGGLFPEGCKRDLYGVVDTQAGFFDAGNASLESR